MNIINKGTPKTLAEAIDDAVCIGPVGGVIERIHANVRDFLAQRFQVAILQANDPVLEAHLELLFKELTK